MGVVNIIAIVIALVFAIIIMFIVDSCSHYLTYNWKLFSLTIKWSMKTDNIFVDISSYKFYEKYSHIWCIERCNDRFMHHEFLLHRAFQYTLQFMDLQSDHHVLLNLFIKCKISRRWWCSDKMTIVSRLSFYGVTVRQLWLCLNIMIWMSLEYSFGWPVVRNVINGATIYRAIFLKTIA